MGLIVRVGSPGYVYTPDHAALVARAIYLRFGYHAPRFTWRRYASKEIGWSWISDLKEHVAQLLGHDECPHLMACDCWQTAYLPISHTPCELPETRSRGTPTVEVGAGARVLASTLMATVDQLRPPGTGLICASIGGLSIELRRFADKAGLPTGERELRAMRRAFWREIRRGRFGNARTGAYLELSHAAQVAMAWKFPLWVVK